MALKIDNFNPVYDDKKSKAEAKKPADTNEGKEKKVEKETKPKREFKFEINPHVKKLIGIALLFFAVYLAIASISFISNGYIDQSQVDSGSILQNAKAQVTKNAGGAFGAAITESLLNKGFGIGIFFMIYFLFVAGLKTFNLYKKKIVSTFIICSVATITTSSILGLLSTNLITSFHYGGSHGTNLNQFLINLIGIYGTIFVNIFLVCILITLCIKTLQAWYGKYKEKMELRRAKKEEQRLKEEEEKEHLAQTQKEEFSKDEDNNTKYQDIENRPKYDNFAENEGNNLIILSEKDDDEEDDESSSETSGIIVQEQYDNTEDTTKHKNKFNVKENEYKAEEASANGSEATMTVIQASPIKQADVINQKPYDPTAELSRYKFPPTSLLKECPVKTYSIDKEEQEENKKKITKTLGDYGIEIKSIQVCVGPTVTLYEIIPAEGVRIAKIKGLEDDIALSLAALGIRIIAPMPGKGTIGIEVPNKDKQTVYMRSIIESEKFQKCKYDLPIAMGSTISNDVYIADLTKTPHLLVAGATGMGKSVGLNAIITCLLYKKHPAELKFVMIDPKMVEFSIYAPLENHYLAQMDGCDEAIITDMNKAVATLNSLVQEMENRLLLLNDAHERNIKDYNNKFISRKLNPEKGHRVLPYIVVIIDELSDLIMNIGRKEVEIPIARITQKARAVGIHMILATQRPSTDVITGLIKANCPSRIAFRVTQMVDSRTILARSGAQQLIGRGDMLINYDNILTRVQCAFVDTPEVGAIVESVSGQIGFDHPYMLPKPTEQSSDSAGSDGGYTGGGSRDSLFEEAAEFIINSRTASTSSLQRRFSIGYNRAGKIMDQMEEAGVVGPAMGGKPRQILVDTTQLARILNQE